MNINEFKQNIANFKDEYHEIAFKIEAIKLLEMECWFQEFGTDERNVKYCAEEVIKQFLYKEQELIYFVQQFLSNLGKSVYRPSGVPHAGTFFQPLNNLFPYYFDSLIAQFYSMIETEQRIQIEYYFNNSKTISFYPNRNKFGLWWEIYMLRNRVVHYTEPRYTVRNDRCFLYQNFSSACRMVRIDNNSNISLSTTLIDIYKNDDVKKSIEAQIISKERGNPFDVLFPLKTPKGYGKKNPMVLYIGTDIYFDYVQSGSRLLEEIKVFLNKINDIFFQYLYVQLKNQNEINDRNIALFIDEKVKTMKISELFADAISKVQDN